MISTKKNKLTCSVCTLKQQVSNSLNKHKWPSGVWSHRGKCIYFLAWSLKCCTKEQETLLRVAQMKQMRFFFFSRVECGELKKKKPLFMKTFGLLAGGQ